MKITAEQMRRWMAMEAEHSKSKTRQRQIVMQHIAEHGIHYYPQLTIMEQALKRKYG